MNLLTNSISQNRQDRPAPASGWHRASFMAWNHFWKLIAANILFVVFSLPVVTLPAALVALDRVCVVIYRDGNIFLWYEFWREFRRSFIRSLLPGLGFGMLLFGGYFFMSLGNGNSQLGFVAIMFWALGIFMTAAALAVGEFFFIMISTLDIRNFNALKNAIIFCAARPGTVLAILFLLLFLSTSAAALMPLIGSALIFFVWIVGAQYPICYMVYALIEEMILIPYKEQNKQCSHPQAIIFN